MPLTSGRNTPMKSGQTLVIPVAANVKIFEGALVVVDAGHAKPGIVAEGLVAAGRAEEYIDNTNGAAGEQTIVVRKGIFLFSNDSVEPITGADLLKDCFVLDDETVSADGTGRSVAGKVIEIDSDGVWVQI